MHMHTLINLCSYFIDFRENYCKCVQKKKSPSKVVQLNIQPSNVITVLKKSNKSPIDVWRILQKHFDQQQVITSEVTDRHDLEHISTTTVVRRRFESQNRFSVGVNYKEEEKKHIKNHIKSLPPKPSPKTFFKYWS